jgi:hypothetical protein
MAFREVAVTEIREVLRAWLSGSGLRKVAEQAGVDRKTARRYVAAAAEAGLARDGGPGQLTDELVGQVAEAVRPVRPGGHGRPWERLEACQAAATVRVADGEPGMECQIDFGYLGVPVGRSPISRSIGSDPFTTFLLTCTFPSSVTTATWERLRCTSMPT